MRKRRRLANKMTIMVCAVLIAVSTFFYAPMNVSASESVSSTGSVSDAVTGSAYKLHQFPDALLTEISLADFGLNLADTSYYHVTLIYNLNINVLNTTLRFINVGGTFFVGDSAIAFCNDSGSPSDTVSTFTSNGSVSFVSDGLSLKSILPSVRVVGVVASSANVTNRTLNFTLNVSNVSVEPISANEAGQYEAGYNAGYSAGESAGQSSGYSSGYSDGYSDGQASVDTDSYYDSGYQAGESAGYESGFQAGVDSVDTQSFYDAGYQAGYDIAYQAGYDSGYEEAYDIAYESGYNSAMDRISNWGADTSDYPVLKYSFFDDELRLICDVFTSAPSTSYASALLCYLDFDINPNHTYKFVVKTGGTTGGTSDALYSDYKLNFVIGSNVINATNNVDKTFDFFIPGYNMGSSILFEAFVYDCVYYGGVSEDDGFLKYSGQVYPTLKNCYIDIYDMGPSGDTQNHIANQTDQLTNGYDDSKGNSVNSELSTGLDEYETAENSLFATATTGLKDFTFFDFESVPAMITGMSFIGSIMGSWFNQAGGASGVGIVLSILFSVILVAMVLGLYRWYQSRGGKN